MSSLIYGWEDEYFWTALQDINETGSFHWLSGDEVTYTHWNRNQPGKSLYHVPNHKSISVYTLIYFVISTEYKGKNPLILYLY